MPKMRRYASFDDYLEHQSPRHRTIIRALRRLVTRVAPALTESVKWGNGCWLGAAGRPVAYVYSADDHVQFGFFNGSALADPRGLLRGSGRYVRHVRIRSAAGMDRRAVAALLRQAARPRR